MIQIHNRFTDVELFEMFNISCGVRANVDVMGGTLEVQSLENGEGFDLWEVHKIKITVDKTVSTPQDIKKAKIEERQQRARQMAEMYNVSRVPVLGGFLEVQPFWGVENITDLLPKPKLLREGECFTE